MKAIEMLDEAHLLQQADYKEADAEKRGIYRGGNSGAVMDDDTPTGACPRLIHLRVNHGKQPNPEELVNGQDSKRIMFAGGFANEWAWGEALKRAMPDTHVLMEEEELGLRTTLTNGLPFSGRPDAVFARKVESSWLHKEIEGGTFGIDHQDVIPEHVLEYKGVFSIWTARDVRFQNKPKLANIIQCARYQWELSKKNRQYIIDQGEAAGVEEASIITGELLYTSYAIHVVNDIVAGLLPKWGQPGYEKLNYYYQECYPSKRAKAGWSKKKVSKERFLELREKGETFQSLPHKETGEVKTIYVARAEAASIKPFAVSYEVEWRQGSEGLTIHWRAHGTRKWTDTTIDINAMDRLYMQAEINLTATMEEASYSACQYCELKEICESNPKTAKEFEEKAIEAIDKMNGSA
jgi:hypothetical protein